MRGGLRASAKVLSVSAIAAVVGVTATSPLPSPPLMLLVAPTNPTVLVMGGTGHPLSAAADSVSYVTRYLGAALDDYVGPSSAAAWSTGIPAGPYNGVAVITPEENAPNHGTLSLRQSVNRGRAALHDCLTSTACDHNEEVGSTAPSPTDTFVVFGYSQSAAIAMLEKARLAGEYPNGGGPDVSFVTIGGSRPNGGLVARDVDGWMTAVLLGQSRDDLITDPVPTDTRYPTVDIAIQYDGFSDFPLNPWNLVANLNAYMGVLLLHTTYAERSLGEPDVIDQGGHGDTRYYLLPTDVLPLLQPLEGIPVIGRAIAETWDPVLRVIVESAYDRSRSPGEPTPFDPRYSEDPVRLADNVAAAIPIGADNGIETLLGFRPMGTERPGPYGVGGSDLDTETPRPSTRAGGSGASGTADLEDHVAVPLSGDVAGEIVERRALRWNRLARSDQTPDIADGSSRRSSALGPAPSDGRRPESPGRGTRASTVGTSAPEDAASAADRSEHGRDEARSRHPAPSAATNSSS